MGVECHHRFLCLSYEATKKGTGPDGNVYTAWDLYSLALESLRKSGQNGATNLKPLEPNFLPTQPSFFIWCDILLT